ncbi:MAG: hypothetical protein L3K14_01515 [Thermoplasmata archaeon]|nr:hypothetical protein [Thermoplasmata archaeon]
MKLVGKEILIDLGGISDSVEWKQAEQEIELAIRQVDWPVGSGSFSLFAGNGPNSRHENGVVPIKEMFLERLADLDWGREIPFDPYLEISPGDFDATHRINGKVFCVEWETGNVSSSHRSMNKMVLALIYRLMAAGILVLPSRKMYQHLTDRIGNFDELKPYLPLWRRAEGIESGLLAMFVVEHDSLSEAVPHIAKGTDGRALR